MALKLRRPALATGSTKTGLTTRFNCGEWEVGRIYQTRRGPDAYAGSGRYRQRSDDARGSGGDTGRGEGAVSEELGRLEGVGQVGRVALASLSPLAALPNSRRFSVNLLRGGDAFLARPLAGPERHLWAVPRERFHRPPFW